MWVKYVRESKTVEGFKQRTASLHLEGNIDGCICFLYIQFVLDIIISYVTSWGVFYVKNSWK